MSRRPDFSHSAAVPEPTYSITEVAAFFGCTRWVVDRLCYLGRLHPQTLHPAKGGLWPTYKPTRERRIPLSAINRHLRHQARVHGDPEPPALVLIPRSITGRLPQAAVA